MQLLTGFGQAQCLAIHRHLCPYPGLTPAEVANRHLQFEPQVMLPGGLVAWSFAQLAGTADQRQVPPLRVARHPQVDCCLLASQQLHQIGRL
ncbi:hypothetical protein D3C77_634030 [compost metagenome]